MPASSEIAIILMTKREALEANKQIHQYIADGNLCYESAGTLLKEMRDRDGWKALGHASFKSYCEKEAAQYGGRTHIYALIQNADVNANLSDASDTPIPIKQTRLLGQLPPEKQAPALEAAAKIAGGTPTTKAVETVVDKWKKSGNARSSTLGTKAKEDPDLKAALIRIGKVCGAKVRAANEDGVLDQVERADAIAWSKQSDELMVEIEPLVTAQRWGVTKAIRFLSEMLNENHRIRDLILHCLAAGGTYEATIGGVKITAERVGRKRDEHY